MNYYYKHSRKINKYSSCADQPIPVHLSCSCVLFFSISHAHMHLDLCDSFMTALDVSTQIVIVESLCSLFTKEWLLRQRYVSFEINILRTSYCVELQPVVCILATTQSHTTKRYVCLRCCMSLVTAEPLTRIQMKYI